MAPTTAGPAGVSAQVEAYATKYLAWGWWQMMAVVDLLGVELESLAHLDADAVGAEELDHLGVVLEVGAGRVAPRVAATPVLLAEQAGQGGPVLVGEAPLLADPAVPVLGQRLGHLHAQAVR